MRFSFRQHAIQTKRLDSRLWQKDCWVEVEAVTSGVAEPEGDVANEWESECGDDGDKVDTWEGENELEGGDEDDMEVDETVDACKAANMSSNLAKYFKDDVN
jgi:hypothetical protein